MDPEEIKAKVLYALRFVTDPEIPINVVDLGLIRKLEVEDSKVYLRVVMTAPGCPYSSMIVQQIEESIRSAIPELEEVKVELEIFPPWTPFDMTERGREQFKKMYGYDLAEGFLKRYGSVENYYELVRKYYGLDKESKKEGEKESQA
ncbi:MAG: metal-sulfur cluster assembly factor [Candidatus Korarchaeota archaeon]|nr:metal-sulfur cluster assembly factor [Candidatus Korarchaeota archaeon]